MVMDAIHIIKNDAHVVSVAQLRELLKLMRLNYAMIIAWEEN
jgi:hypothetical protein